MALRSSKVKQQTAMRRYGLFGYALLGYVASLVTLTYLIFWLWPWDFMPYTIDRAVIATDLNPYLVDTLLLLLFGLQHSLMARGFFKERIMRRVGTAARSATYALASSLALVLIFLFWQPLEGRLWAFEGGFGYGAFLILYVGGWSAAFVATFMIDHFALFGLHQGYRQLKGIPEPTTPFQARYFYKYVRHPIQAGTMVGLFATPVMSYGHLLFSLGMGLYILIGLWFEERSLIAEFGATYEAYRKTTPMLFPLKK